MCANGCKRKKKSGDERIGFQAFHRLHLIGEPSAQKGRLPMIFGTGLIGSRQL
jgi:hypothetical protein